jgi:hypothetical protein
MSKKKEKEQFFTTPAGQIRDRIIIHESADLPKEGIFLSLNGYPFLAKAGVPIDIPRPVRLMLDTRIKTVTVQGEDGKDYHRDMNRITYTLVKEGINIPEPEVVAAASPGTQVPPVEQKPIEDI